MVPPFLIHKMKTIRFYLITLFIILLGNIFSACSSNDDEKVRTIVIKASIWPEYECYELLGYDYVDQNITNSWDNNDRVLVYDNDDSNQPYIGILTPTNINGNNAILTGTLSSEPKGKITLIRTTKKDLYKYDTPKSFQPEYSLSVETDPAELIQYWRAKNVKLTQEENGYGANVNLLPLSGVLMIISHENSVGEIAFEGDESTWQLFTFPQGISYISFKSGTRFTFKFSDGRLLDVAIEAGKAYALEL